LLFANGALLPLFTHNWAYDDNIKGFHLRADLLAVGTDKKSLYKTGGYWGHCADLCLYPNGKAVLVVQANELGITASKLTFGGAAPEFSGVRLVAAANGHNSHLRLGGIGRTSAGYLIGYVYGADGFMWIPRIGSSPPRTIFIRSR